MNKANIEIWMNEMNRCFQNNKKLILSGDECGEFVELLSEYKSMQESSKKLLDEEKRSQSTPSASSNLASCKGLSYCEKVHLFNPLKYGVCCAHKGCSNYTTWMCDLSSRDILLHRKFIKEGIVDIEKNCWYCDFHKKDIDM
jgi:hypothetical protein